MGSRKLQKYEKALKKNIWTMENFYHLPWVEVYLLMMRKHFSTVNILPSSIAKKVVIYVIIDGNIHHIIT